MRSDLVRVRNGQSPMAPIVMSEDERTAMLDPTPSGAPTRRLNGRHTAPPPVDEYGDYYDEEPRRSTGKMIGIVAAVLVALGLVGFVAYQVFGGSPAPTLVAVPTVTGLAENDARSQILSAGLRVGEITPEESAVEDDGTVIRTDPTVGTEVPEGRTVNLVVGSGPASVNVPRLEGMTVTEATGVLEQAGLELGAQTQQETPDRNLVGRVIASTPRAGEPVEGGSTVAIIIGSEQTSIQIPDLAGQELDDAEQALRDLGLSPQREDSDGDSDSGDSSDRVSGTDPAAGQRVPRGSEVTLLTGSSGEEIEMPDVEGQRLEAAQDRLRDLGFQRIQVQEESVTSDDQDGRVQEQSPRPGERVTPDQQITLTVGDAPGVFG
jgi:serine/threonine-protein kinase